MRRTREFIWFPRGIQLFALHDAEALQPVEDRGLQRDAMIVVAVIGFHVRPRSREVAGFAQRFGEGLIVGIISVRRFHDENRSGLQIWSPVDVVPFRGILFGFREHSFRRRAGESRRGIVKTPRARVGFRVALPTRPKSHAEIAAMPRIAGS